MSVGVSIRFVHTVEVSIKFSSFLDKISFKCTVGDNIWAVIPLNYMITSYFITFISIKCSKAVLVTVIFLTSDKLIIHEQNITKILHCDSMAKKSRFSG